MAVNVAALRSQIETALAGRVPAPFARRSIQVETAPFNIAKIDQLTGGLPHGGLDENFGPSSSRPATFFLFPFAFRNAPTEVCALVGVPVTFPPSSSAGARRELGCI